MFITPAFAQSVGGGGTDTLLQFLPFVLIFVIIYFLILRPQQKRVKQHKEMVDSLRRGDTVVMQGGLIGKVTKIHEDGREAQIEVGQVEMKAKEGGKAAVNVPVRVRVVKQLIAEVRAKGEPASEDGAS